MSDLKEYIATRKKTDKEFSSGYDEGYEQFKPALIRLVEFFTQFLQPHVGRRHPG